MVLGLVFVFLRLVGRGSEGLFERPVFVVLVLVVCARRADACGASAFETSPCGAGPCRTSVFGGALFAG